MSDDLNNKGMADRDRINVNEIHELVYWSQSLEVTEKKLKETVAKVGPMVRDVKKALGK